jgi:hypothetical protein
MLQTTLAAILEKLHLSCFVSATLRQLKYPQKINYSRQMKTKSPQGLTQLPSVRHREAD